MAVRKFKPTTPGQRHKVIGTFEEITATVPEKSLVTGKRSTGGRNNDGKMTMRYRGGGHKRKFRFIDFKRNKDGIPATVKSIEYDPNRSARIALLCYADGVKTYIIAPNGLEVGTVLYSGADAAPEVGNTLPLRNIPIGTVVHNIELRPGQGAMLVRSAGNFAQIVSRDENYCVIKLPSGEIRRILGTCRATVGTVGNSDHALESSGKAGRSRWLGRRPHNRGVVMNPVDHPMGGGEGRASGGHPRSRKGLYAKGLKTRAPTLMLPSAAPLIGSLMLGNLFKESGVADRLCKTAQNELMNIVTIFLGFTVGATAKADTFLQVETIKIIILGVAAFGGGTAGGVLLGNLLCKLTGGKINPLIGSAGVSAVPMAARVSQKVGQQENPANFLLMHAMGPNVAGVIGSAICAGVFLALYR